MKKATIYSMLTGAALLAAPVIASAAQDVVRDERDNVITNTWENCVLTKWDGNSECGEAAPAPIVESREELTIYFGFDSDRLTPAAVTKLERLSSLIKNSTSVEDVSIVGYADQIGNSAYNQRLSLRRAKSVRNYLSSKGINTSGVSLKGLGEVGSDTDMCDSFTGAARERCLNEVEHQTNKGKEKLKNKIAGDSTILGNAVSNAVDSVSSSLCLGASGSEKKACLWRDRRVEIRLNYR